MTGTIAMTAKAVSFSFGYHHVFRNFSTEKVSGEICGITGPNGSGKSTLLKVFSGAFSPSSGTLALEVGGKAVSRDKWYRYCSIAAPYTDVIETFTPLELIRFYRKFKADDSSLTYENLLSTSGLEPFSNKMIRQFSSGMIQRMRLILALGSASPLMLLDEPTSNLDDNGKQWLYMHLKACSSRKLTFIASNDPDDVKQCSVSVNIMDYKQ